MTFSTTPAGIPIEVEDDSSILTAYPTVFGKKETWKFNFPCHLAALDALSMLTSSKKAITDYHDKILYE